MTSAHPAERVAPAAEPVVGVSGSGDRPASAQVAFVSRREHFARTASTNDVVAAWLVAGTPEVCVVTADEQTRGRGREGRTWQAPAGSGLLVSLGFRPGWLAPDRTWQLAAVVALAMAQAAEAVAELPETTVRLKWPNDLVIEADPHSGSSGPGSAVRKLAGVLGESTGLGTDDPQVVIGVGINVDWERNQFPPDLADGMTSLRDAAGGRPVDRELLAEAFLDRLATAVDSLRGGKFALAEWRDRQITTGQTVDLIQHDEHRVTVRALGVDPQSGGLIVVDDERRERVVHSGEIQHVRLAPAERGV